MWTTLTSRRWLGWIALALVWTCATIMLGRWQWHRFETRHAAQNLIDANYDARPDPLRQVLGGKATTLPRQDRWRQVSVTGHYERGHQILIRNRPNDGDYGYEVVLPFTTTDGQTAFVDRGWVPNGEDAAAPPPIPAAPQGQVTVIAWLRPSEPDLHKAPIPGQLASINVGQLQQMSVPSPYNLYLLMRSEKTADGSNPARPAALPPPDQGMSAWINFSYALQWWLGAAAAWWFVIMRARRDHLDSLGVARAPKKAKVRIWDEEDE